MTINERESTPERQSAGHGRLIGRSAGMRDVYEAIDKAANVPLPVLIVGETGTGKELVAREIHDRGPRANNVFLPVHTGTMSSELVASELFGHLKGSFTGATQAKEGCFADARGGTLFLDEIATMDEAVQVALLRVLESGKFRPLGGTREVDTDVRIVAASCCDLSEAVAAGAFRPDLQHRLQVLRIHLPPLRERREDIPPLAESFLDSFCEEFSFDPRRISDAAMGCLCNFDWPGNLRELRNAVAQAALNADGREIGREHLPPRVQNLAEDDAPAPPPVKPESTAWTWQGGQKHERTAEAADHRGATNSGVFVPLSMSLDEAQRLFVCSMLRSCGGNKTHAAQALGISRKALYDKLARWEHRRATEREGV